MKATIAIILIVVFAPGVGLAQSNIYDSIYVGKRWRTYLTHLPKGFNNNKYYPLVLAFHGGQNNNASAGWTAIAYQSKLSQKADAEGFIVVYPEGTVFNNNRTWNAGNCCPPAMNQKVDDVGFVDHLLDTLFADYPIDSSRVYATGSSNGGMLCYRLACELSNRFAAVAPNACSQMYFPCQPTRKIPIINFHSLADKEVPVEGGIGTGPSGVKMTSQDSTLQIWRQLNNGASVGKEIDGNGSNFDFKRMYNCDCGVEFHHYLTTDGGHSWPGGNPNNNPVSTQISATDLLWSFFSRYTLNCEPINATENAHRGPELYPNPAIEEIYISHLSESLPYVIFNTLGQLMQSGQTGASIPVDVLPSGIYTIKIGKHQHFKTYKFVRQ